MPIEIIAEVAQGYEGDPTLARLLARGAVYSGADAVKFQLVYADEIATPDYQYYQLFQSLEMPEAAWKGVVEETKTAGVRLYFDVFGEKSLRQAVSFGADGVKIHSTDFFNTRLICLAFDLMPSIFISIGGISLEEIEEFIRSHQIQTKQDLYLMYGFQAEPTPIEFNNLSRLAELKKRFYQYKFGFMDHTDGSSEDAMSLALMVIPLGIECIEKHISLDRILKLEDYVSALSPGDFRLFIQRIRNAEKAIGIKNLDLTVLEEEYRKKVMKVVVARVNLKQGDRITPESICLKRVGIPNPNSSILRIEKVVGSILKTDVQPNQQITKEMLR